ncbi:hypothetical protein [Klebsiella quasivariicola]|nr:hypothetical protein [Klebsiella quasivariicola]
MSYYQPVKTKHNYDWEYLLYWPQREADRNTDKWSRGIYRKPSSNTLSLAERIAQRNNRKLLEDAMGRTDGYYKQANHVRFHWYVQEKMDNDDEVVKVFEYDFTENAETNARRKDKFERENNARNNAKG